MAESSSIWKKELTLRRRPKAPARTPVPPPPVEEPDEPAAPPLPPAAQEEPTLAADLAAFAVLNPKFRELKVLTKLVAEHGEEFPALAEQWALLLPSLEQSAVNGVLPPDRDPVVRTLFRQLLLAHPEPPKGRFARPQSRASASNKAPAAKPLRVAKPSSSFWEKELSLGRKPKPAPAPPQSKPKPKAQRPARPRPARAVKPAAAVEPEQAPKPQSTPFWKKELSLGRKPRPAQEQPVKEPAEKKPRKAMLKRDLSLPRLRLPQFQRPSRNGGASSGSLDKLVGLRIGSSQLAAALVHNNGSAELLKLARTPLRPGLVADGEVRDAQALGQALKSFFAQHKLPRRGVRLGVATNRIGVRVIEVSAMDDPKLFANAIRFRAQEVLPIPVAQATLDHVVLGEAPDKGGPKQLRVLLVFAHRELVDGYVEACRTAGLKLAGIDFDAFALLRALSDGSEPSADKPASALVAVAIGRERTIFAVSEGTVCDFTRVLEWGGASLDTALALALGIPVEEAEAIKHKLSLADDSATADLSPVQVAAARAALSEELQVLARELLSSLQFYQSRPDSLDIGEVLLTGGGAQLGGIDAELGRQLGVPVRVGDPLCRVKLGGGVSAPTEPGSLAIAVGLAIEA